MHILSFISPSDAATKWAAWSAFLGIVFKALAEGYSSVVAGGGLKRIFMSFVFGEQVPKVIANDYKAELSTAPFPKNETK